MKRILFTIFLVISFLILLAGYNSNPKVIISRLIKNEDIRANALKYRIYFLGIIPIGEGILSAGRLEEFEGKKVYHLNAAARTLKYFSKFFNGDIVLDSYVDIQEFNPILFKQGLMIKGKEGINREIIYNQKEGFMSVAGIRRQIFPNTQDPLSLMFNLMHLDLVEAKEFKMNINAYKKNYTFRGTTKPRDVLINSKTYKMVLLKGWISRQDKNPYHQSSVTAVLLNQKENIPLLIKVFSGGVLIQAKLVDIR